MRLFLIIIFSLTQEVIASSCCVSNTGLSNLMIIPSKWQQTISTGQTQVIGDVDPKGESVFRNSKNKERTIFGKLDLGYAWTKKYQSGISLRYQNRRRDFYGNEGNDSGWNDVGLTHAYAPSEWYRFWVYQSLNIPTATSTYDSRENFNVDAHGTGTYQINNGVFYLHNLKEWDFVINPDVSYSFSRNFEKSDVRTEVSSFWGAGLYGGVGYIPWRSKMRYGLGINPRYFGRKKVRTFGTSSVGDESLVWDTSVNVTYSWHAQYALGMSYVDQTLFGPARNTLLNRTVVLLLQSRWM